MKKRIAIFAVIATIGVLIYWGFQQYLNNKPHLLEASGTIEATKVTLTAKVPGTISEMTIEPGDHVKSGQLAGKIVRNDLVAQKERDALTVLKAEAQLNDLLSGSRQQEIAVAMASVSMAKTNYEKALVDYQRAQKLFQNGALARADLETMETALNMTKSQLESATANLNLMQSGSRENAIVAAQMEVERSKAILKATEAQLEDTNITIPIDGTVLTKNFEVGEFIPLGGSIATVANLNNMWIRVYVPTDDLPKIKLGQKVHFTVSGSNEKYSGSISEIVSQGEFTPKTIQTKEERTNIVYAVKIKIDNQTGILKPGMPADVRFN